MIKILINAAQCNSCKDFLQSFYEHDFQTCSCGNLSVDGGRLYLKRGFTDSPSDYIDYSVYVEDDVYKTCFKEEEV